MTFIKTQDDPMAFSKFVLGCCGLLLAATLITGCCAPAPDYSSRTRFESAEAAFAGLIAAMRKQDTTAVAAMLGPASDDVISSGDPIADRARHREFLASFDARHRIEMMPIGAVLIVGADDWPMPIPAVRDDLGWFFDTEEGVEEILDRRVGRNELMAIQSCLAFGDAQADYASADRDGDGLLEYAQRIRSTPGKKDGLYWKAAPGEAKSPLGDLAARASADGYAPDSPGEEARPYHGYYYRVLTSQGPAAEGGAYDYMVGDSMVGGFALIAYPARYGVSGVMTFMVNHQGVVMEKDLGPPVWDAPMSFDPKGWKPVVQ